MNTLGEIHGGLAITLAASLVLVASFASADPVDDAPLGETEQAIKSYVLCKGTWFPVRVEIFREIQGAVYCSLGHVSHMSSTDVRSCRELGRSELGFTLFLN